MTRNRTRWRASTALAVLLAAALSVAGCVSMPSGGPVQSYLVTQATSAQSQQFMQMQPQPPGAGWTPQQVVQGFLAAAPSFNTYRSVVNQYLTPAEQRHWHPDWSAEVYGGSGPSAGSAIYPPSEKHPITETVYIDGTPQASLQGIGGYSVSTSPQSVDTPSFTLQKVGTQWRISTAPTQLLLTADSFQHDYQLTNLYFFDPTGTFLVPDPVYVPLGASPQQLMSGLVSGLIRQPKDWLAGGATTTAFPEGTRATVQLNGATATVNLTGAAITKASNDTLTKVSGQLWSTLGATRQGGQQVKAVQILLNNKFWPTGNKGGSPVVRPLCNCDPPTAPKPVDSGVNVVDSYFYYLDTQGYLVRANSAAAQEYRIAKLGTGYSEIAVSPDADAVLTGSAAEGYVAALRGGVLYAGMIGEPLKKLGGGFTGISWDRDDNLWATTASQVYEFPGTSKKVLGLKLTVKVPPVNTSAGGAVNQDLLSYSSIAVAPDGIRVAIVQAGVLTFGAISGDESTGPTITLSRVADQPTVGEFKSVAWYGANYVVTLAVSATAGPAVTEYPVSGAGPISVATDSNMNAISARAGQPLVADLSGHGLSGLVTDVNTNGSWARLSPAEPPLNGTPVAYPG